MLRLIITRKDLRNVLETILATPQKRTMVRMALGISRYGTNLDLLARGQVWAFVRPEEAEAIVCFWPVSEEEDPYPDAFDRDMLSPLTKLLMGVPVGIGLLRGRANGIVRIGMADVRPLDEIRVVGPGMARIDLVRDRDHRLPSSWLASDGLYSRTIGAMGPSAFETLQDVRITVIGAGGNGSAFSKMLAPIMGGGANLSLVDPDRLLKHNLPTWGGTPSPWSHEIGKYKVEILAEMLGQLADAPAIDAFPVSAMDWRALPAVKQCDLLVSCLDSPQARLAASFLATLYHKPLLDVATGVFLGANVRDHQASVNHSNAVFLPEALLRDGPRSAGGDVRLTLPSNDRAGHCLLCAGGVGDLSVTSTPPHGAGNLFSNEIPPFWIQRAGSLASLNGIAVSAGLQLLIQLLSGNLQEGTTRLQLDMENNIPHLRGTAASVPGTCPLCLHAGKGDSGLKLFDDIVATAASLE